MTEFDEFVEERARNLQPSRWDIVRQDLNLNIPNTGDAAEAWKRLAISLHDQVGRWEQEAKNSFRHNCWDFCVIHSADTDDVAKANKFLKLMKSIALTGRLIGDLEPGEDILDAAEKMVEGSCKVFILVTPTLNRPDLPQFTYQEALIQRIYRSQWRRKLVPLIPSGFFEQEHIVPGTPSHHHTSSNGGDNYSCYSFSSSPSTTITSSAMQLKSYQIQKCNIPFGLANIGAIKLISAAQICDAVHKCISPEEQGSVHNRRTQRWDIFKDFLRRSRLKSFQQITDVFKKLSAQFTNVADPTEIIDEMVLQLDRLDLNSCNIIKGLDPSHPIIKVWNSSNVSMGNSINFSLNLQSDC